MELEKLNEIVAAVCKAEDYIIQIGDTLPEESVAEFKHQLACELLQDYFNEIALQLNNTTWAEVRMAVSNIWEHVDKYSEKLDPELLTPFRMRLALELAGNKMEGEE